MPLFYSLPPSCFLRTSRCLLKQIRQHCPALLNKSSDQQAQCAFIDHLQNLGHNATPDSVFKVICRIQKNNSHVVQKHTLATFRSLNLLLCNQKMFIRTMRLFRWPAIDHYSTGIMNIITAQQLQRTLNTNNCFEIKTNASLSPHQPQKPVAADDWVKECWPQFSSQI